LAFSEGLLWDRHFDTLTDRSGRLEPVARLGPLLTRSCHSRAPAIRRRKMPKCSRRRVQRESTLGYHRI